METLAQRLLKLVPEATFKKSAVQGLKNAQDNLPHIRQTILDLALERLNGHAGSAIVIAAGPSLHRNNPARLIRESGYRGAIVACDGALGYCLRNDVVPHYVVTVDPHPYRIVRWFGDPHLTQRQDDDYFRRQEQEPSFHRNELAYNDELIQLVNRFGPRVKAIISTSASRAVTERCLAAGMDLYWWNPLYDDYDAPKSYARRAYELTKAPCMATGGHCGGSAWVFASAVLKAPQVAIVGMDLGYPPGLPIENTQYYKELKELLGDRIGDSFIEVYNPHLKQTWYTDPVYYYYRDLMVEMAQQSDAVTYNCTEGGILFGEGLQVVPLKAFLEQQTIGACTERGRAHG